VSHRVKEERNFLHAIKRRKVNWIGHILSRNYLINGSLKERERGREDEEEDLSSNWMTLKKREGAGY
jgi:hypothetical protein